MSKPHNPWSPEEGTEVLSTDGVLVDVTDSFGIYYPADGLLTGGYSRDGAEKAMEENKRYRLPNIEGAYIVKYSIERVED